MSGDMILKIVGGTISLAAKCPANLVCRPQSWVVFDQMPVQRPKPEESIDVAT